MATLRTLAGRSIIAACMLFGSATAASAHDFTCQEPYDHCLAQQRDNVTFYVDTDGSMNADSGLNVDGSTGTDSYWRATTLTLDEIARDNHNPGTCNSDNCDSDKCDGFRIGIGYFGDDSIDDADDNINAYRMVSAGENRRDDVLNSLDDESAGNDGLPGIQALECPPDGSGQLDTIECPPAGVAQVERIVCPTDGVRQISEITCPVDAGYQYSELAVTASAGTPIGFTVNGTSVSYTPVPFETAASAAEQLRIRAQAEAGITSIMSITRTGAVVELTALLRGESYSVVSDSPVVITATTTPPSPGLPQDPPDSYDYTFKLNSSDIIANGGTDATTSSVCSAIAQAINDSSEPVSATSNGTTVTIVADIAGAEFDFPMTDPELSFATLTANVDGLPDDPGDGYDYTFDLNSSTIATAGGPNSTSESICTAIRDAINNGTSEPVTASLVTLAGGHAVELRADSAGNPFTIGPLPGELSKTTLQANSPGLPGSPAPNHVFTFDFNGSTVSVPTDPSPVQLCADIAAALQGTGVVSASASGSTVTITAVEPGGTWTIDNVDPDLDHNSSTGPGLPGDPPPNQEYRLDIDGTTVSFTDDGTPTQAEVCEGLADAINAQAGSIVSATEDGSVITVTGNTPAQFVIDEIDPGLTLTTVRVAGLGPSAYGALGERIYNDMGITSRTQNAVVITARAPEDFADMNASIAALCARRDDSAAPAITHFIGFDLSPSDQALLDVLAAAGGSGECTTDPCTTAVVNPDMTVSGSCSGSFSANASNLKNKINEVIRFASCTLKLNVPPSYADGQAPNDPEAVFVEIRDWDLDDLDGNPDVFHPGQCRWWGCYYEYWNVHLWNNHDVDWDDAYEFRDDGWHFVDGDRSRIYFSDDICDEIRGGHITEIRTNVACLCANQGEECTDSSTSFSCKSQIAGEPDGPCTAEQLANMRCATGVYICDDGVETCSAGGTNAMPEICNGIDDDCDGIVDNVSNGTIDDFDGREPEGRACNFRDTCICPDGWKDTPSAGTNIDSHLNSWTGNCVCGEGLEEGREGLYTPMSDTQPADGATMETDSQAACSVGMGASGGGLAALAILGALGLVRRRRR